MSDKLLLESPVFDVESALKAAEYGIDRLELCSAFTEGGLTPGPGMLSYLKSKIGIPIFVMIRPRGGNFVYSKKEIDVMKEEIQAFLSMGADGFVFGVLNANGTVQKDFCKQLVETAKGKPCTFHRAIDVSSDIFLAMEDVIDCGFQRILTSGGKANVGEGLNVIRELLMKAEDRIIIMPGGGTTPQLVKPLKTTGFLKEVHASCKKIIRLESLYQSKEVQFSVHGLEPEEQLSVDERKVQQFKRVL